MLTAMVVFTLIASSIYALLQTGTDLSTRGAFHARMHQSGRAALRAIEADLRGAWSGTSTFDTGFRGVHANADPPNDTLELVAFNRQPSRTAVATATTTPPKEMDLSRVIYSIDSDPSSDAKGLVRERHTLFGETATNTQKNEILETVAEDVVGLAFRYYDGSSWADSWDSASTLTLPKAVEITVHVKMTYKGQEETEKFTTRLYLPVAATAPKKEQ